MLCFASLVQIVLGIRRRCSANDAKASFFLRLPSEKSEETHAEKTPSPMCR